MLLRSCGAGVANAISPKRGNLQPIMRWPDWMFQGTKLRLHCAVLVLLVALTCGLYVQFLHNPLVFDDQTFFSGRHFAYYAMHPLGLLPRVPAYFSLAVTHVLSGSVHVHRMVSLAFHVSVVLVLYWFVYELLRGARRLDDQRPPAPIDSRAAACALLASGAFALHPAAVYGAAYLVQRSVVVATLFALLSLVLFLRAITHDRYGYTLGAAACYSVAVLSKEHSILLPVVALPLAFLASPEGRRSVRHLALYLGACAPAAVMVVLMMRQLIGQAYEPHFAAIGAQVEATAGHAAVDLSWWFSAVTQAGLFFRYAASWFWPDTEAMSIDWRIDFFATASVAWGALKVLAFVACGALGFTLLRWKGRTGVIAFGILYVWILFLVEMSVSRFQEPFVLYRSYLWAPGFAIALAAVLAYFERRVALAVFAAMAPLLLYQAHDRLMTFASPLRLWEDAAAKLPAQPVPWGSRVLYNVGREYLYAGQPDRAIAAAERCMSIYPGTFQCVYARGAIHFQLEQFERALEYFERAAAIEPKNGIVQHRIGMTLERLERLDEAAQRYRDAESFGYGGGRVELDRLRNLPSAAATPKKAVPAKP